MSRFTVEESNLICIYNTGSRADLLSELTEMQRQLATDETEKQPPPPKAMAAPKKSKSEREER